MKVYWNDSPGFSFGLKSPSKNCVAQCAFKFGLVANVAGPGLRKVTVVPTGKIVVVGVPQDMPGALQFVPSILSMRPANGVHTNVQGLATAMLKVPVGYTFDGNVQLKTPLSTTLFPAVTATMTSDGATLIATFDKALIDNNMPEGAAVPLVVTANFMNAGVQKQLSSTANVRVVK